MSARERSRRSLISSTTSPTKTSKRSRPLMRELTRSSRSRTSTVHSLPRHRRASPTDEAEKSDDVMNVVYYLVFLWILLFTPFGSLFFSNLLHCRGASTSISDIYMLSVKLIQRCLPRRSHLALWYLSFVRRPLRLLKYSYIPTLFPCRPRGDNNEHTWNESQTGPSRSNASSWSQVKSKLSHVGVVDSAPSILSANPASPQHRRSHRCPSDCPSGLVVLSGYSVISGSPIMTGYLKNLPVQAYKGRC